MSRISSYYYQDGWAIQGTGSFSIPDNLRNGCTTVYFMICGGGGGGSGCCRGYGTWHDACDAEGGGGGSGQLTTGRFSATRTNRISAVSWTTGGGGEGSLYSDGGNNSDAGGRGGDTVFTVSASSGSLPYRAYGGQGGRGAVAREWCTSVSDGNGGMGGAHCTGGDNYSESQSIGTSGDGIKGGNGGSLPYVEYYGLKCPGYPGGKQKGRTEGAGTYGSGGGGGVWESPVHGDDDGIGGNGGAGWIRFRYDIEYNDVSSTYDSDYIVVSGLGEYLHWSDVTVNIRAKNDSDPGINHSHEQFRIKIGNNYYVYDPNNPSAFAPSVSYTAIENDISLNISVEDLNSYEIIYNGNGATSGSTNTTVVKNYDPVPTNVTFSQCGFFKTGSHFIGWKIDNEGTVYTPGQTYLIAPNTSKTAYAQWRSDTPTPPSEYTGTDGLTYTIKNTTLTISGEGQISALYESFLSVEDEDEPVEIAGINSIIVGEDITSVNSYSFVTYSGLIKIITIKSPFIDNGNIIDGDYSVMVKNGVVQPDTYVYIGNDATGTWYNISDAPFILVLDPNGGTFQQLTEEVTSIITPSACVAESKYRNQNGETINTSNPYSEYTDFIRHIGPDGTEVMVLPLLMPESTEITVRIKDLPSTSQGGNGALVPPAGFDNIRSWEVLSPYFELVYRGGAPVYKSGTTYFEIKLSRATRDDNVRHSVLRPFWVPKRDDRLRALIAAPGLGSLDFENVQAVSVNYNSSLTAIPIVCRGFTGTYCMDLGVSKTITINYLRVSPANPDNDSVDSRQWDNATWQRKLREFQDRWQLMTNGCSLYLKRPDNPRLANGFKADGTTAMTPEEIDPDPMVDMIEEINGENCYIQSAPITFKDGKPYSMQSSISLKMGTLYPKQEPVNTVDITYIWQNLPVSLPERKIHIRYPADKVATVPTIPATWTPYEKDGEYIYATTWYDSNGTLWTPNTHFVPSAIPEVNGERTLFVIEQFVSINDVQVLIGGVNDVFEWNFTATANDIGTNVATLKIWAVGAGGGGGGGVFEDSGHGSPIFDYDASGGGGGGASGVWANVDKVFTGSMNIYCRTGRGGAGGEGTFYDEQAGYGANGGPTEVRLGNSSGDIIAEAAGGWGGIGAHHADSPGGSTKERLGDEDDPNEDIRDRRISWPINSFEGGAGGGSWGGREYFFQSQWANSGNDGKGGNSNGGKGGQRFAFKSGDTAPPFDPGSHTMVFGGGGGGGGCIVTDMSVLDNVKGGAGFTPYLRTESQTTADQLNALKNGGYGCGGGGGLTITTDRGSIFSDSGNGGNGGNGVIIMILENGSLTAI